VSEGDGARRLLEDAGGEALVEVGGRAARDGVEEPQLSPGGYHGDDLEQAPRRRREGRRPREHRVPHRLREGRPARSEHLRHVERVALREPVEGVAVGGLRFRQGSHGVAGEPRHREPRDARGGRQLAEDDAEWMVAGDLVVPVRGEDERRRRVDPAPEHAQGIERRLVCPVHVLEDDDGRLVQLCE
jgi:hypothetical protein